MENASKALIIAGAILISILLISVGIIVMNSINKPVDQAGTTADAQAIEMFNSRFSGYIGKGQTAQAMKSLINTAKSTTDRAITITGITSIADLDSSKKYIAEPSYGTDQYINGFTIKVDPTP